MKTLYKLYIYIYTEREREMTNSVPRYTADPFVVAINWWRCIIPLAVAGKRRGGTNGLQRLGISYL